MMPDFDILGSGLYASMGPASPSGFDVIGANASGQTPNGQTQNGRVFNSMPLAGQQPGGPVSGSVAGLLGLQTVPGANLGTTYLAQSQGQAPGAQPEPQPYPGSGLMAGILGLPRYGNPTQGAAPGQPQPAQQPGGALASAIGTGARSLFDGLVYGANSRDV